MLCLYIASKHHLTLSHSLSLPRSLVFRMVEAEEEYVDQLETLISCFLRPFKMAASSKSPPCNHEDVNSIFLGRQEDKFRPNNFANTFRPFLSFNAFL